MTRKIFIDQRASLLSSNLETISLNFSLSVNEALVNQEQYVDQEGLKLIEILLPLLARTEIKGVSHYTLKFTVFSSDSDTQSGACVGVT